MPLNYSTAKEDCPEPIKGLETLYYKITVYLPVKKKVKEKDKIIEIDIKPNKCIITLNKYEIIFKRLSIHTSNTLSEHILHSSQSFVENFRLFDSRETF